MSTVQKSTRRGVTFAAVVAASGESQAQWARRLGVTQPAISRWLQGKRAPRARRVRLALVRAGVDARTLI